jgi:DNA polymerase
MIHKEIQAKYKDCKLCESCDNKTKVFGGGNWKAKIAVIGEGPGKDEVVEGVPFVGEAGKLLNNILAAVQLKRDELFFTNSVICRTNDKNRTPTTKECINCRQRLYDEIFAVQPRFTLLVGATALKTIMGEDSAIMKMHGQWYTLLDKPCYFYYVIPHPAWILHSSTEGETKQKKKIMWTDIQKFRDDIKGFNDFFNWSLINDEIKAMCKMQEEKTLK